MVAAKGGKNVDQSNRDRALIAVFANPDTRRVAARMMLGESLQLCLSDVSPSKSRRITSALSNSGLIARSDHAFRPEVFREVLEATPVTKRVGLDRFLDGTRIRQYPASLAERGELLEWVARRALNPGEVVPEREINDRLREYSDDVAVLRRYLVDFAFIERRTDGSEYALSSRLARDSID